MRSYASSVTEEMNRVKYTTVYVVSIHYVIKYSKRLPNSRWFILFQSILYFRKAHYSLYLLFSFYEDW